MRMTRGLENRTHKERLHELTKDEKLIGDINSVDKHNTYCAVTRDKNTCFSSPK